MTDNDINLNVASVNDEKKDKEEEVQKEEKIAINVKNVEKSQADESNMETPIARKQNCTRQEVLDPELKTRRPQWLSQFEQQKDPHLGSKLFSPQNERFLRIKKIVKDAITAHHTFMVYGRARVIRECLLKRGWVEKFYKKNNNETHLTVDSNPASLLFGIGELKDLHTERQLMSKMLSNHTVDFLWNSGSDWPGWPAQDNKTTIFNRFSRAGFTSKIGLCSNVRQMHWYYEAGVANTLFPRCYNICQADQLHAFIEDFRFTACLGLLKWVVDKVNADGENAVRSPTGTVPLKALDFAIRRCTDFIGAKSHEDIDQEIERVWAHQWDQFINWYYKIVQGQALLIRNNVPFHKYFLASRHILKKIRKYCPQMDMDGILNIWILKPGNKSRGRGIVLMNNLEDVLAKVNPMVKTDTRYVVQKYIERPFLIYKTKFDIRQWFIVTCAQPLTLWMFKESYLRFCTQNFSLENFHESIHLCNNAIQCKYKNSPERDPGLPVENMWDATTYKQFLKAQGHGQAWDDLIYPGMKQGLVGSMLASQDAMDRRKNSFELYGADFMVMEDFSVWLIEINSHPDMSNSTSVTARLCRKVMEDTIKVVVDYRQDKNADTGLFELAYKQRVSSCQPYLGAALSLQGTRINVADKKSNTSCAQDSKVNLVPKPPPVVISNKQPPAQCNYIGPAVVDLIEELEIQLDQEFYDYLKLGASQFIRQALPSSELPKNTITVGSKFSDESTGKSVQVGLTVPPIKSRSAAPTSSAPQQKVQIASQSEMKTSPYKRTGRTRVATNVNKGAATERQTLVSKIMDFQKQSLKAAAAAKQEKMLKQEKLAVAKLREENSKLMTEAMKEAAGRYRRVGTMMPEIPPMPSFLSSAQTNRIARSFPVKPRNKTARKRQNHDKKNKVIEVTDIFAVGLGLTQ